MDITRATRPVARTICELQPPPRLRITHVPPLTDAHTGVLSSAVYPEVCTIKNPMFSTKCQHIRATHSRVYTHVRAPSRVHSRSSRSSLVSSSKSCKLNC